MKRVLYIIVLISLMIFTCAWGLDNIQQNNYRQAISFEKSGEYSKAESLYVDLYTANPDNFNYRGWQYKDRHKGIRLC